VPDFKALTFNKQQPYVTFFLDNSNATLVGKKSEIERSVLYGSKSNDEYKEYQQLVAPYEIAMANKTPIDNNQGTQMVMGLENFIKTHPASYVSPLAIYKLHQMTENAEQMTALYSGLNKDVQSGPIGSYIRQQIAEFQRSPMGKELEDFSQADPSGKMVSLKSFRGKYVLVDFWASWCGPCRNENPNVVRAYKEFKDKGFTVLGVSLDRDKQKWLDAVAADGLTWTQVSDLKGWGNEVAQKFGITSIPQNFLVDPDGKVVGKNLRGEALDQKLKSILK
jgi:peroxiredoxin